MVTGSFSMFMFIWLLQKAIKFGNEVGLAYQSPPPAYFNSPIFTVDCASEVPQKQQNRTKNVSEINLLMRFLNLGAKVRFLIENGELRIENYLAHR
jgi:hypothetical protein